MFVTKAQFSTFTYTEENGKQDKREVQILI